MGRWKLKSPTHNKVDKSKSYRWIFVIAILIMALAAAYYYQLDYNLYLTIAGSFVFALFTAFISQKPQERIIAQPLISACIVAISLLSTNTYDKHNELAIRPEFTIKTTIKDTTIDISLRMTKGKLSSWIIDHPVNGVITRFINPNSAADVKTISMARVGQAEGMSLNNAEIIVEDIEPNTYAKYIIVYRTTKFPSHLGEFSFRGRDRYKVTYKWKYKGNEHTKTEWYLIRNDQKTEPPGSETKDIQVWKRALTDEELKKYSEESHQRTLFTKETFN